MEKQKTIYKNDKGLDVGNGTKLYSIKTTDLGEKMENKYQYSIDWIYHNLTDIHENGKDELSSEGIEHLLTLQELIDKYNSIKGDYMSYKDLKAEYESELELYKKAFEIALDELQYHQHLEGGLYGKQKSTFESDILSQAKKELNKICG